MGLWLTLGLSFGLLIGKTYRYGDTGRYLNVYFKKKSRTVGKGSWHLRLTEMLIYSFCF